MQFLLSCYGANYAAFLAVCLRSLRDSHPDASIVVTYDEVPADLVAALAQRNPRASFEKYAPERIYNDQVRRISSKIGFWRAALEKCDSDLIAFVDIDTIVRGDLKDGLPADADLLLTVKEESVPINTGVIVARKSEEAAAFLNAWEIRTNAVIDNIANFSPRGVGGPDQQAALELLGDPRPPVGMVDIEASGRTVRIACVPCEIYNETRPVPVCAPARVLHYKGSWHKRLLQGRSFRTSEDWAERREMYYLWRRMVVEEEKAIGRRLLPLSTVLRNRGGELRWKLQGLVAGGR